jgi:AraC family transcriptional regulator of adaptative response/methylated-DNA-[protein]-cysteine methyltransferase
VCGIDLGDSPEGLIEGLRARFPKARLVEGDRTFEVWIKAVVAHIEQPDGLLDLPLDVRGTVFQQRVWRALRDIPRGATASYAEIAARIGQPQAVRAVARACASNRLAVAVPCHRAVRSDGELAGYRWGVERKAELLRREAEK